MALHTRRTAGRWATSFTLSVGARYDVELIPTPNGDNPLFVDNPGSYPKDLNNIAPRVGFSYALDSEGKSAMHGGFGLFYQRTVLTPLTPMVASGRYTRFVRRELPAEQHRPRSAQRALPDRSDARERSNRQSGAARRSSIRRAP